MILLSDRWEFYKDKLGQWQWRKFVTNKVVAVSSDGFYSRQACMNNARTRGYVGSGSGVLKNLTPDVL